MIGATSEGQMLIAQRSLERIYMSKPTGCEVRKKAQQGISRKRMV
jgi:hypothetical protein